MSEMIERVALDALASAETWLERWASHVGSCEGGQDCTCGLTAIAFEVSAARAMIDAALKETT